MSEVLVIGHRNPDTDAICSAIGYAEFKRRTGMPEAVAARCGETNERIDFVLRTFNTPPPRFIADVSPKVADVMQHNVVSVGPHTSVVEALAVMEEKNLRMLPVLNDQRNCLGLLSVFKASKFFFPSLNRIFDSRRVLASLRSLCRVLQGTMLCAFDPEREDDLILMVATLKPTSFAARLPQYPHEKLAVIVGDREDIQRLAVQGRVRVVIVTGGLRVSEEIQALAQSHEVSLIVSPHDSATTAMLCRAAIAVEHLLHQNFQSFHAEDRLADIQRRAVDSQQQAFPVLDLDERVVGVITKSCFLQKTNRRLILVDHNELSQAVSGANEVEIIEIIDHHRIGAFSTQQPILFRNEPVGSTSTIVADCFKRHGVELPPNIAGLLLAGLVSDTLNLTSPTTTARDVEILPWLEALSNTNAREFTEKLFDSGSVLVSKPAHQAITTDCKEYVEGSRRFSVAQIEEIGFDHFHKRKVEVRNALEKYRADNRYDFSVLLVTDVVLQTSLLLVAGNTRLRDEIQYPEPEAGIFELDGIVSRKKQLLPYLTHMLTRLDGEDE